MSEIAGVELTHPRVVASSADTVRRCYNNLLTVGEVKEFYEVIGAGRSIRGIAQELDMSRNTVRRILMAPQAPAAPFGVWPPGISVPVGPRGTAARAGSGRPSGLRMLCRARPGKGTSECAPTQVLSRSAPMERQPNLLAARAMLARPKRSGSHTTCSGRAKRSTTSAILEWSRHHWSSSPPGPSGGGSTITLSPVNGGGMDVLKKPFWVGNGYRIRLEHDPCSDLITRVPDWDNGS